MKKTLMLALGILLIFLAISQKDMMIESIESGDHTAIFVSAVFVAMLVFFPVLPFPVVAGLIGSVFGFLIGTSISLLGIIIGMMIMFWMARYGFQDWVLKVLKNYPKAQEYEGFFEQNAFISILIVRLVPVIPSPLVNILCGISKVRSSTFLSASLIGKVPAVIIFTLAGSMFEGSKLISISIYAVYFIIIMAFTVGYYKKQQPL